MRAAVDNLVREGLAHHQAGRLEDADRLYRQALAIDAKHADALNLTGVVALQSGRPVEAADLIGRAAQLQPRNWAFRANLASALLQLDDVEGAAEAFRTAAKLNPDDPQLQIGAANCIALRGDVVRAEAQLRKVVRRFPKAAAAWLNLGNAVRDQGRLEEAAKLFRRAVDLDPHSADARTNLGSMLHQLQRFDEALTEYRAAVALSPGDPNVHCNLASAQIDIGNFMEAESIAREALRLDERSVIAHSMLSAALSSQGRLREALPVYRAAAALAPHDARLCTAFGCALFEAGLEREGIELLERVQANNAEAPAVHQGLAWAYLATGDFERGWREYAHRPARGRVAAKQRGIELTTSLPADLSGKRVCLIREQGLGDELFFARFARLLLKRGASLAYVADSRLVDMFRRTGWFTEVLPYDSPFPAADYYALVGDLPLALGSAGSDGDETTPPPVPLTALPERVEELRARLSALGPPPYIGLTWRGGIAPEQNRSANWAFFKHIPLAQFAKACAHMRGTFIVVQRHPEKSELEVVSEHLRRTVHDLSALNEDLESMLALLTLIDEYVGVSNTNMHLRAGVAKGARVLVPAPAEWRWLTAGETSPWFPGFHVYRQGHDGDWSAGAGTA